MQLFLFFIYLLFIYFLILPGNPLVFAAGRGKRRTSRSLPFQVIPYSQGGLYYKSYLDSTVFISLYYFFLSISNVMPLCLTLYPVVSVSFHLTRHFSNIKVAQHVELMHLSRGCQLQRVLVNCNDTF